MRYLLDSDGLSDLYDPEAPSHEAIARWLSSLDDPEQVFLSILALYEIEYGCANAPEEKKALIRQRISAAQEDFAILPLTARGAESFGRIKASLRKEKEWSDRSSKTHNIDLMLAATAISEDCILVSRDSLYQDIQKLYPELTIESW